LRQSFTFVAGIYHRRCRSVAQQSETVDGNPVLRHNVRYGTSRMNKKELTETDIRTKFITPAIPGANGEKWNVMT
jgi:hypothetical protein